MFGINAKKSDVSVYEAMKRAEQKEMDLFYVVQVVASDWDSVVLCDEVKRLRGVIAGLVQHENPKA